ncbi:MAG: sporulation protein YunB [Syntrophomonadaceae bacterium]|nr:sporulation protein YunB [Syntrophomonadaceae bacterium]
MSRHKKRWLLIIIVAVLIISIIIDVKIKSSVLQLARSKAQLSETAAINRIVNERVVNDVEYRDLVAVHKDDQGRIVMIQPNTIMLNKIMTRTVIEVTEVTAQMREDSINIPVGQLLGPSFIAGYGPKLKVKIIPAGEVKVNVLNKFDQAGVNQTRHLIYFKIDSNIKIAVPYLDETIHVSTVIPLAETIIVGEVPKTYLNFSGNKDSLYPLMLQE